MKKVLFLIALFLCLSIANIKSAQIFGIQDPEHKEKVESESKLAQDKDEKEEQEIDSLIEKNPKTANFIMNKVLQQKFPKHVLPEDALRSIFKMCQSSSTIYKCRQKPETSYCTNLIQLRNKDIAYTMNLDNVIRIFGYDKNKKNLYNHKYYLEGHTDFINSITELSNGDLVSCSNDCSIKMWRLNAETNAWQCITTLNFPHFRVLSIVELPNKDLVARLDGYVIRTLRYNTTANIYQENSTFRFDSFRPLITRLHNGNLAIAIASAIEIRRYNTESDFYQLITTLPIGGTVMHRIFGLSNGDIIAIPCQSCKVYVWHYNAETNSYNRSPKDLNLDDCNCEVNSIHELSKGRVALCFAKNTKIIQFDETTKSYKLAQTLKSTPVIELSDRDLLSYCPISGVQIWTTQHFDIAQDDPSKTSSSSSSSASTDTSSRLQNLYNRATNNPYKTLAGLTSLMLVIKYRNQIAKLLRK